MADDQLLKRAEEMFQKGQWDYAISLFKQALLKDLASERAHRGLALAAQKKLQAAGGIGGLKAKMMTAKTTTLLATASKNAAKRAEVTMNHLAEDPNNDKVRLEFASACADAGALDGGIVEAIMAAEINPKNWEVLKALGMMLGKRGRPDDIVRAQACLESATALKPDDRELGKALRDLAAVHSMSKTGLDKAKDFRDIIKDKDKAADMEKRGHLIRSDEDFAREIKELEVELAAAPKESRIAKKIGDLYAEKRKDFQTASQWYQKSVEINPKDSTLKDKVDDMKMRMMDANIEKLKKENDPKVKEAVAQKLKFETESFERRVADRPTDPSAKLDLGKRYFSAGLIDKSVGMFQQSVKDPKLKVDSHTYLGLCFQGKKMYDLADQQYEMAEKSGFVAPERQKAIWYQRAKCKFEAGDKAGAVDLGKRIMTEDIGYKDISALVEKWLKD